MRTITYSKALNEALDESLAEDENVIIYGCDVGRWGGIFKITGGLQTKYGADRVFDSPISENVLVGAGVGAAVMGLRPVVELQFADFLITAGDEVFFKAGMWRFMHGGAFKVPMVLRLPSGETGAGPEHSACPEAYVMHSPGLLCCVPSTPADAKALLKEAIRSDNPVMFFEHRRLYQQRGEIDDDAPVLPFGKAAIRREGRHVTIVAWQMMLNRSLKSRRGRWPRRGSSSRSSTRAPWPRSTSTPSSPRSRRPALVWWSRRAIAAWASAPRSARGCSRRPCPIWTGPSAAWPSPTCRSRPSRRW